MRPSPKYKVKDILRTTNEEEGEVVHIAWGSPYWEEWTYDIYVQRGQRSMYIWVKESEIAELVRP